MTLRLLLWLKARLVLRSFSRRSSAAGFLGLLVLGLVFAPFWAGAAAGAFRAVRDTGGPALITVFAMVQVSWLYIALMLGAFSEAFDLRRMLRYPIEPRAVYWLNVLATPVDVVALLLFPPLVAAALGAAARSGPAAGIATGFATVLLLLLTSAILQILLALLADLLKHEWARAAGGLFLGVAIFAVSFGMRASFIEQEPVGRGPGAMPDAALLLQQMAVASRWLATASVPAAAAALALDGEWARAAALAAASILGIWVLVRVGARAAVRAALDRETRHAAAGAARSGLDAGRLERTLAALLPPQLAVLVERDIRYYLRTPQILIGLATTPLVIAFFFGVRDLGVPMSIYWATFFTLMPALNLSANQFGLDREGIKTFFLLPLRPRDILLAKNLTIVLIIAAESVVAGVILALVRFPVTPVEAVTALLGVAAALPALLVVGNVLSVRSPWRMTFRVGGAPKGAVGSAFAQIAVLGAVALMLAVPVLAGRFLLPGWGAAVPLGGVAVEAALSWLCWALLLDGAAASLEARREQVIDTLVHAEETG